MQTHAPHDGPVILMFVNHKDVVLLIHSKGLLSKTSFLSHSHTCGLLMHEVYL